MSESSSSSAQLDYGKCLAELVASTLATMPKGLAAKLRELPLTGPGGVRQLLGEISLKFFAQAYFPQYFTFAIPPLHEEAYEELSRVLNLPPSGRRLLRVWPRSYAKSTIYNFFTPANAALYGKRRFSVQFSASETQAQGYLADIRHAFEENDHVLEDFGNVQGDTWRADLISVKALDGALAWIGAAGSGSNIRGIRKAEFRPSLITLDDPESDESVMTTERINKLYEWFRRALSNLGTPDTDVIVVGTILAYESVIDKLTRHPGWDVRKHAAILDWSSSPLWDEWRRLYTDLSVPKDTRVQQADAFYKANQPELLDGTHVLWPEGRPYVALMKILTDIGEPAFYAEYQNDPISAEDQLFKPEWITYYTQDELDRAHITDIIGALDPSLGKNRMADYTAFVTIGRGQNGVFYVLDAVIERMTPDKIIELVLDKVQEFRYRAIGVEVHAFQELLRSQLFAEGMRRGVSLPLVDVRHSKDKIGRVSELIPVIKNGYLRFNPRHTLLMEQLIGFPRVARKDDGPDALQQAFAIIFKGQPSDPFMSGSPPPRGRQEQDYYDSEYGGGFHQPHFFS